MPWARKKINLRNRRGARSPITNPRATRAMDREHSRSLSTNPSRGGKPRPIAAEGPGQNRRRVQRARGAGGTAGAGDKIKTGKKDGRKAQGASRGFTAKSDVNRVYSSGGRI